MTAGYGLAGTPSSGMSHAVAPGVYREVTAGDNVCCSVCYQGAFERLERSDAKVSRAVLRGPCPPATRLAAYGCIDVKCTRKRSIPCT